MPDNSRYFLDALKFALRVMHRVHLVGHRACLLGLGRPIDLDAERGGGRQADWSKRTKEKEECARTRREE